MDQIEHFDKKTKLDYNNNSINHVSISEDDELKHKNLQSRFNYGESNIISPPYNQYGYNQEDSIVFTSKSFKHGIFNKRPDLVTSDKNVVLKVYETNNINNRPVKTEMYDFRTFDIICAVLYYSLYDTNNVANIRNFIKSTTSTPNEITISFELTLFNNELFKYDIEKKDIDLIIDQTGRSSADAIKSYIKHNCDIVDAIIALVDNN